MPFFLGRDQDTNRFPDRKITDVSVDSGTAGYIQNKFPVDRQFTGLIENIEKALPRITDSYRDSSAEATKNVDYPEFDAQAKGLISAEEANKLYGDSAQIKFKNSVSPTFAKRVSETKIDNQVKTEILNTMEKEHDRPVIGALTSFSAQIDVDLLLPMGAGERIVAGGLKMLGKREAAAYLLTSKSVQSKILRVGVGGAIEGAVGNAAVEPIIYAGNKAVDNEYSIIDSVNNIFVAGPMAGIGFKVLGKAAGAAGNAISSKLNRVLDGNRLWNYSEIAGQITPDAHVSALTKAVTDIQTKGEVNVDPILTYYHTTGKGNPDAMAAKNLAIAEAYGIHNDFNINDYLTKDQISSLSTEQLDTILTRLKDKEAFTRSTEGLSPDEISAVKNERSRLFNNEFGHNIKSLDNAEIQKAITVVEGRIADLEKDAPQRLDFQDRKGFRQADRVNKKRIGYLNDEIALLRKQLDTKTVLLDDIRNSIAKDEFKKDPKKALKDSISPQRDAQLKAVGDISKESLPDFMQRISQMADTFTNNPRFKEVDITAKDLDLKGFSPEERSAVEQAKKFIDGRVLTATEMQGLLSGDPALTAQAKRSLNFDEKYSAKNNLDAVKQLKEEVLNPTKHIDDRQQALSQEYNLSKENVPDFSKDPVIEKEMENLTNQLINSASPEKMERIKAEIDKINEEKLIEEDLVKGNEVGTECIFFGGEFV